MADTEKQTTENAKPKKKTSWLKRIIIILIIIVIGIQFIQPGKNNQSMDMTNDISTVVNVPDTVKAILKVACNDCHSNFTVYPWYSNIQPVGWWLKDHIDDGKKHLNFQEFATLKPRPGGRITTVVALQAKKLEEVAETIEKGEMPLNSYTIIHKNAILTEGQKKIVTAWVDSARAQLGAPPVSIEDEKVEEKEK